MKFKSKTPARKYSVLSGVYKEASEALGKEFKYPEKQKQKQK